MKTIFKLAIALLAVFSFAACSDVPMPYEEPGTGNTEEPTTEAEAKGTGTAADPYNVAAALKTVSALAAGEETPTAIYVKGAVKEIKEIETEKYGNANYYITDDGKNQIYIFQSYYLGNRKFTANDKLTVGDTVVVYGKFTNYQGNTPETVGKGTSYIYSLNGETAGTTPETPTTSEAKGSGTQADPYNAAAANKAAEGLKDGEEKKDVYVSGIISQIKELSTQFGNASFYISDDGKTEGSQFYVFRALYLNGDKFTAEDQIKVGQKVVVKGSLVNYNGNTPELAKGGQIVSVEGSGTTTPETPTSGDAMTIDNIKSNKTGNISLDTNKYGSQSVSDESTWYSWTFDGITYQGAKICISDGKNGEGLQMQGNATDASKQGFLFNKTAFSKSIKSITLVLSVATSSKYGPEFNLYAGTEAHPKAKAISATPEQKESGNYKEYTYTFDLSSGDYKYFTLANDKVGAIYVKSMKVTLK